MKTKKFTRRSLIKVAAASTALFFINESLIGKLFAGEKSPLVGRTEGVYEQDMKYTLRKSQDNPYIKAIYAEYLEHPNSEKAHHLLHTEYIDRSAKITALMKKGVKFKR